MKKHKLKIKLDNLFIEPQAGDYEFFGPLPLRIGEITYIAPDDMPQVFGGGLFVPTVKVILLADKSGRKWLVETR